jgi:RNA polymerase sigma-70 factor (ECF subfamily)
MNPPLPFEEHRQRLTRLAHRMLGSMAAAEDVVQDAYVKYHQANLTELRSVEAWLVTVVTRLAIDELRSAQVERKAYVGTWLPEPWMQGETRAETPEVEGARHSDLSYAALVLLERLSPEERAVFLLRDVFEADYAVIAEAVSKTEASCRQLLHRAHERLAEGEQRYRATPAERLDLLKRFHAASMAQDRDALVGLFAPHPTYATDGGGKVFASPRLLEGVERICRLILTVARKDTEHDEWVEFVDGEPALVTYKGGAPYSLTFIESDDTGILRIFKIMNPEKLGGLAALRCAPGNSR